MLSKQPEALKLAHKLAYSFADSIMQSTAPLTMRPQQQALCAVCHALVKYGMEKEAVLMRYMEKACLGCEDATVERECMLDALKVRCVLDIFQGSVRQCRGCHAVRVRSFLAQHPPNGALSFACVHCAWVALVSGNRCVRCHPAGRTPHGLVPPVDLATC
jgi:hypothetical protein